MTSATVVLDQCQLLVYSWAVPVCVCALGQQLSSPCVRLCAACLLQQAVARQQEFEKSAVGKATMKAVKAAKQKEQRPEGNDFAQDWRS